MGERHVAEFDGDTCHSLIGPLALSLTRALMRDWFLHDTWQISVSF